jgi:antitoxin VapB
MYTGYISGGGAVERAKIFRSGRSQAVRLPKQFRLKGSEVYIKHVGNAVLLLPIDEAWDALAQSLAMFSADFMEDRAQPAQPDRDEPF